MDTTENWKQWVGQTVAAFPLIEFIGGSESCAVFRTQFRNAPAAIKLKVTDPKSAETQLTRWQQAIRLSHPNLLQLFDAGRFELNGAPLVYAVMEYADDDLSRVIPDHPLDAAETLAMLEPTLDALEYVHRFALVHRNLKPSNIMACGNIIKLSSDSLYGWKETLEPRAPTVYDAPETSTGSIFAPAALWSLGVALVEIMTERVPVWPDGPSQKPYLPPELPQPFLDIVRACLRPDPQQRWTILDIRARLHQGAGGARKRHGKTAVALVAVVALAILAFRSREELKTRAAMLFPAASQNAVSSEPVPSSPGTISGVAEKVMPDLPVSMRRAIGEQVHVNVKVQVDTAGNVSSTMVYPTEADQSLSDLTVEAAKQWKFHPLSAQGRAVPQEWLLEFSFLRNQASVAVHRLQP